MEKFNPTDILISVKTLVESEYSKQEAEKELETIAYEWKLDERQLKNIYRLMASFYAEIEALGGEEKYKITNISWLGVELELLFECYRLSIDNGMNIIDISQKLSNEETNIFPKTPSQLQNTYYKVKKNKLPFEDIAKNKPGRKRKTDKDFVPKSKKVKIDVSSKQHSETKAVDNVADCPAEPAKIYSEKNFVKLLSGMINNFQAIYQNQENGDDSMYHLIEGIYTLSSIAAQKSESSQRYKNVELELQILRNQLGEIKMEKEGLIHDFRSLTDSIQEFITSSEMTQIQSLPNFIEDCKDKLNSLGLSMKKEKDVKLIVDNTGQLISINGV